MTVPIAAPMTVSRTGSRSNSAGSDGAASSIMSRANGVTNTMAMP
jgi:hypothetical protein